MKKQTLEEKLESRRISIRVIKIFLFSVVILMILLLFIFIFFKKNDNPSKDTKLTVDENTSEGAIYELALIGENINLQPYILWADKVFLKQDIDKEGEIYDLNYLKVRIKANGQYFYLSSTRGLLDKEEMLLKLHDGVYIQQANLSSIFSKNALYSFNEGTVVSDEITSGVGQVGYFTSDSGFFYNLKKEFIRLKGSSRVMVNGNSKEEGANDIDIKSPHLEDDTKSNLLDLNQMFAHKSFDEKNFKLPLFNKSSYEDIVLLKPSINTIDVQATKGMAWDQANFIISLYGFVQGKYNNNKFRAQNEAIVNYTVDENDKAEVVKIELDKNIRVNTQYMIVMGQHSAVNVQEGLVKVLGEGASLYLKGSGNTIISHKQLFYDMRKGIFTADDDVEVYSEGRHFKTDFLKANLDPLGDTELFTSSNKNKISDVKVKKITALGSVRFNTDSEYVEADKGVFNIGSNNVSLDDNVMIKRFNKKNKEYAGGILFADHMDANFVKVGDNSQEIRKVIANSNVKYVTDKEVILASWGVYFPKLGKAVLYDVIEENKNSKLASCKAYVDLNSSVINLQSCKDETKSSNNELTTDVDWTNLKNKNSGFLNNEDVINRDEQLHLEIELKE